MKADKVINITDANARNVSLDIAKGIGIVLVVLGHTKAPREIINFIYCFHMPLFFVISGYLFKFDKWKDRFSDFFRTRFERLLVPYFVMSLLFFYPFWFFLGRHFGEEKILNVSPIKEFIGIFYGSAVDHYMSFNTPLWFLPCLFVGEGIFLFLLKYIDNEYRRFAVIFITALIGAAVGKFYALPWGFDVAMVVQPFFYIGYILKTEKITVSYLWMIIALLFLLVEVRFFDVVDTATRNYNNLAVYFAGGIAGTSVVLWFSRIIVNFGEVKRVMSYLGVQSMSIFMWHSIGFKFASILFVYGLGVQLTDAHEQYYIIYALVAILFSLLMLQTKNLIQKILIAHDHKILAKKINW